VEDIFTDTESMLSNQLLPYRRLKSLLWFFLVVVLLQLFLFVADQLKSKDTVLFRDCSALKSSECTGQHSDRRILSVPFAAVKLFTNFSTHGTFLGITRKREDSNKLEDTSKDWAFLDENTFNSTTKIITANKTEDAYSLLKYITRENGFVGKDVRSVEAQHHCKRLVNRSLVSNLFLFLSAFLKVY